MEGNHYTSLPEICTTMLPVHEHHLALSLGGRSLSRCTNERVCFSLETFVEYLSFIFMSVFVCI